MAVLTPEINTHKTLFGWKKRENNVSTPCTHCIRQQATATPMYKGQTMAPSVANGEKQKENLGVLSHTMQGFTDYIANMPEVRGCEYLFMCKSI